MLRRTTAKPGEAVKFGDGKKREASVTKEKVSAIIRNTEQTLATK
jgi:hypothetical protein